MNTSTPILEALLQSASHVRPQIYFKSSLTALSHAIEDQVLASSESPLVIANFQRERFYRQEANRYRRIADRSDQVYVLAAPETDFANASGVYETVAFEPTDCLSQEWHLVVIAERYASCLICRERESHLQNPRSTDVQGMDQARVFEGIWTFDRLLNYRAAEILLDRILIYRPELAAKIATAKAKYLVEARSRFSDVDPGPFVDRLVTYLQAGQYKLLKTYRSITAQERKERLVNSITAAIRQSLNLDDIFRVAVQELGQAMAACRCVLYRCKASEATATIQYEFLAPGTSSLAGQVWSLQDNPLFQAIAQQGERIWIEDVQTDPLIRRNRTFQSLIKRWQIVSWLMVPVLHQGRLLGMVELHYCEGCTKTVLPEDLDLVGAIATQVGVALIQAEAYAHLDELNQQLEALERTRSNLIAITGHELRTPLSTIQVCLESLASEPDMPLDLRQVMLDTALTDAERMRRLVQDFLLLSRLESGRVEWNPEPIPLTECVDLALSNIRSRQSLDALPSITSNVSQELPLVRVDGEWLVEMLAKLLDNACKFTEPQGQVCITATPRTPQMLEVTIADTGRGIDPNRLETVFDRFYQEEGALRRTAGGTGLGLAICRQIITRLGGQIWAESAGRNQGSQFHFTLPIAEMAISTKSARKIS